jgi:hypothetical protein
MRNSLAWLPIIALLTTTSTACGGNGETGPRGSLYQDVAGNYAGAFSGDDQGTALDAVMTISLNQEHANLDGWFHWSGALSDGDIFLEVVLGGELTGSITAGDSPSIRLVATVPSCPGYIAEYVGSYDPVSQTLTLEGQIDVLSPYCNVGFSYDLTIPMEQQPSPAQARRRPNGRLELDGRSEPGLP